MMNATTTAVNRMACNPSQRARIPSMCMTYIYDRSDHAVGVSFPKIYVVIFDIRPVAFEQSRVSSFLILASQSFSGGPASGYEVELTQTSGVHSDLWFHPP